MYWILCGVAVVGLAIWGTLRWSKSGEGEGGVWWCLIAIMVGAFIIGGLVSIDNGVGVAQLEAFYEANVKNYEFAVSEAASHLSQEEFANVLIQGSLEKSQQAGFISERVKEWRDAVNEYNTAIASKKYLDTNIFTGALVPNRIQEMKLLIIK